MCDKVINSEIIQTIDKSNRTDMVPSACRQNEIFSTLQGFHMSLMHSTMCLTTLIARFMWPTWGPSGADRTQVDPMLAPWNLLSGKCSSQPKRNHQSSALLALCEGNPPVTCDSPDKHFHVNHHFKFAFVYICLSWHKNSSLNLAIRILKQLQNQVVISNYDMM